MPRTHEVQGDTAHFLWDERHEPVLTVASGDTVVLRTHEVTDGQLTPASTAAELLAVDDARLYPLSGPIRVDGLQRGDVLAVDVLEVRSAEWGWAGIFPGEGLLPDDFPEPYLRHFDLSGGSETALGDRATIPLAPFLGVTGVCPAGARGRDVMPPGEFGGNLDLRHLTAGSTLYLPVQVEGALLSCGDGHAAQGDGEVCVTAIETQVEATLRLRLERGRRLAGPQFRTAGALTPRVDGAGFLGTTGIGGDLYAAAQGAVRALIERLTADAGLTAEDAYLLASLAADLKITEIVDAGAYVVAAVLPLAVLRG